MQRWYTSSIPLSNSDTQANDSQGGQEVPLSIPITAFAFGIADGPYPDRANDGQFSNTRRASSTPVTIAAPFVALSESGDDHACIVVGQRYRGKGNGHSYNHQQRQRAFEGNGCDRHQRVGGLPMHRGHRSATLQKNLNVLPVKSKVWFDQNIPALVVAIIFLVAQVRSIVWWNQAWRINGNVVLRHLMWFYSGV